MLIIVAFSVVAYRINSVMMMTTVAPTKIFPPVVCKGVVSNIQQNTDSGLQLIPA